MENLKTESFGSKEVFLEGPWDKHLKKVQGAIEEINALIDKAEEEDDQELKEKYEQQKRMLYEEVGTTFRGVQPGFNADIDIEPRDCDCRVCKS